MRPVRVLIVDDSMTMRRLIRLALSGDPRIDVVGEARDAQQARSRIVELRPDVLTLDVEMPGQSGLDLLKHLMVVRPMPVIMVSTLTATGSAAALQALALGAVDCVCKPVDARAASDFAMLPDLVVGAASARLSTFPRLAAQQRSNAPTRAFDHYQWKGRYVLIGSSTGGVDALDRILTDFPANCPPTVICQHMPAAFLASFAQRLNARIAPEVTLAESGMPLVEGRIYLAPGGDTHLTVVSPGSPSCQLLATEKRNGHRPSVDHLFDGGVALGERAVAVMLTGMGQDGANGMLAMRRAGAICIAQDETTSVVWGMPRVAHEIGAVERLVPLEDMAGTILRASGRVIRSA